jgi:hypothetical protein
MKKWIFRTTSRSPDPPIRLPFFALLACLACTGCFELYDDSRDRVRIAGQVLEKGAATPTPIPNAKVILTGYTGSWDNWGGLGAGNDVQLGYTYADDQGFYEFKDVDDVASDGVFAQKDGYITDFATMAPLLSGSYETTNVYLPPKAWIKTEIHNKSGAYAFLPPSNGSNGPKFILQEGQDTVFIVGPRKGNDSTHFFFSVRLEENGNFPNLDYWENVSVTVNGMPTQVQIEAGAYIKCFLPGHDTTHISITY